LVNLHSVFLVWLIVLNQGVLDRFSEQSNQFWGRDYISRLEHSIPFRRSMRRNGTRTYC